MLKYTIFLLFIAFSGVQAAGQQLAGVDRIDSFMRYCQTNFRFKGVVLLADNSRVVYERAFDKPEEPGRPGIRLDTRFRLGSISKQFTAFLAIRLIENGKLSFDDRLAKFIRAFDRPDKRNISIRNLLTHTSGLADFTNLDIFNDRTHYPDDSIIRMIANEPVAFPSSSAYSYSNSNFFLLAVIIEGVSGKRFADVLDQLIFREAGMRNSGEEEASPIANEAIPDVYKNGSEIPAPFVEMSNTKGGGGMYSTAEDLLKWSLYFQRRLSADTLLKNALQPFVLSDGTKTIYACGWCLMPDFLYHTGHIYGFANLIAIDTIHHQTILLLTHNDYRQLYITLRTLGNFLRNDTTQDNWLSGQPAGISLSDYAGTYAGGAIKVHIKDTLGYLQGEAFGERQVLRYYQKDEFFFLGLEGLLRFERDGRGRVVSFRSLEDYHWVRLKKE